MAEAGMGCWIGQMSNVQERVLEHIIGAWPDCQKRFDNSAHEDPITRHLVKLLKRRFRKEQLLVDCQVEDLDPDDLENDKILGRVDIKVRFTLDDDVALVYECKRLNIVDKNGKWSSLAAPYVTDGMIRFVCCQYGREVHVGGMLGYVLDGDTQKAKTKIYKAIDARSGLLSMSEISNTSMPIINIVCFMTKHHRRDCFTPFAIHHNLLGL